MQRHPDPERTASKSDLANREDVIERGFADKINLKRPMQIVELVKNDHGGGPTVWQYSPEHPRLIRKSGPTRSKLSLSAWRNVIFDAFLPVGFPQSVSSDYLAYQTYDSLQAFFSTITSLLSNRALLQGLGVGDADSSATFAMLLTITKDAMSRVATIVFAHRFGLSIEPDAKRYRFLADLFNDTAFFLELYNPYLGSWGKVVALCTGEGLRAMCGVAAGASKAALSLHFAKQDNLSELNAKEASQETAVGLIGLLVGTVVVRMVEDHRTVVYLTIILVLAHLWMNYYGVRSVCMTTINKQRATIFFDLYQASNVIPTPEQVSQNERILFWNNVVRDTQGKPVCKVDFARNVGDAMRLQTAGLNPRAADGPSHTRIIHPCAPGRPGRVDILLWTDAEPKHAILAWFMAMKTACSMGGGLPYGDVQDINLDKPSVQTAATEQSTSMGERLLEDMARKGWDINTAALETGARPRLWLEESLRKSE